MPPDQDQDGAPASGSSFQRETVPAPAVRRLSLYLRELELNLAQGRQTISSKQIGKSLGYTDAQVRKDLAYFGQFGHPGIGYRVDELIARIRSILGTDRTWRALVVGAGHLGQALASYRGFLRKGFSLVAALDVDPAKIGQSIGGPEGLRIQPFDRVAEVIHEHDVELGIVAVPAEVAQAVADRLVEAGIKGILNFAPASLSVPDRVPLASVDLSVHMEQLAFRICTLQVASCR